MKILLLSVNQVLIRSLQDNLRSADIDATKDIEAIKNAPYDLIIADGNIVPVKAAGEARKRIVYLEKDEEAAKEISIPSGEVLFFDGQPSSVLDDIQRVIKSMAVFRNVITFWGTTSGSGVTMTALTVISRLPQVYRALYLSLTDVPGVEYVDGLESSLSDILPRLVAGVLDAQELAGACTVKGNIHYLGGLNSIVDVPRYSVDNIKALIAMAAAHWDYVIIDAGYGASLMAIAAAAASEAVYAVTDTTAVAAARFERVMRQVYGTLPDVNTDRWRLVVNKEYRDTILSSRAHKDYNIKSVASIRAVDGDAGLRAGYEAALIYNLDASAGYRRDMDNLISNIYGNIGANAARDTAAAKTGLFGSFRRVTK